MSVPSATSTRPAATAAPLPPLEPPVVRSRSQGLRAGPKCGLFVSAPNANSCVFSFPTTAAPAARRRATHSASRSGTRSRIFDAAVVGMPATSITSLTATRQSRRRVLDRGGGTRCTGRASRRRLRRKALLDLRERRQDPVEEVADALEVLVGRVDALGGGGFPQPFDRARLGLSMPVYEYRCDACEEQFEEFLSLSTKPAPPCPKCGSKKVDAAALPDQHRVAAERRGLGPRRPQLGLDAVRRDR